MEEKEKHDVIIGGEFMTLVASEGKDYINKLVDYVNEKIVEIRKSKAMAKISAQTKMILVLVNVADDYFKELNKNPTIKQSLAEAEAKIAGSQQRILQLTNEIALLNKKNAELDRQLKAAKKELYDYIEAFDNKQVKK